VELVWVVDFDDGGVEWPGWVTSDLWHLLKVVTSELSNNLGKLSRGVAALWQVVKINDIGVWELLLHFLFI
jgi:hypothetical protein